MLVPIPLSQTESNLDHSGQNDVASTIIGFGSILDHPVIDSEILLLSRYHSFHLNHNYEKGFNYFQSGSIRPKSLGPGCRLDRDVSSYRGSANPLIFNMKFSLSNKPLEGSKVKTEKLMTFTHIKLFALMFGETFKFPCLYEWRQDDSYIIRYIEHIP